MSSCRSGDRCPRCGQTRLGVYSVRCHGDLQSRYLRCRECGYTAKSVVPSEQVRRRTPLPK